ncbi:uncharacterized protein LOC129912282 [Episyrphus balteatus]|uniref:uncharacterized protein LOC129912282 n=1 Tax=Episyrphus balteatus TaxID=286459 RepID=UPI00248589B4|nr:uncharacterized protein LOC129912282 [Episyrphus balteatus]XP_055846456.1 uncharacterized protein LOC129912282 [Episyrphus balteatus]XP_055846457.1 uncharacterized protein LOC129912282 [Episyrphus balteatus]
MRLPKPNEKVSIFIYFLLYFCNIFSRQCIGQQWTSQDSGDGAYNNVSCIAHDTKYTCDCRNTNEYMTLPRLDGYVYQIEISNCKHMYVRPHALANIQGLRTVIFKKVENLILTSNALSFPIHTSNTPLYVEFKEVKIEIIESHAINGNIGEITFISSTIESIRPFAFTTLKDHSILFKMDGVKINNIEPQALKKFTIDQLEIVNSEFLSEVPSKVFYELEVLTFLRIQNVTFKKVHTRAFSFNVVKKLSVIGNKFDRTESEWITAQVRDRVLIKDNNFGTTSHIAFKAIEVSKEVAFLERVELQFINNIVKFNNDPQALVFNDKIQLQITHLQYHNQFPCKELDKTQPKSPFFRTYSENIYFHTKNNNQSLTLSKIIDVDCKEKSYLLYIILGIISLILIVIVITAIIVMRIVKKRRKRMLDVVLPESRTYKETQIVYQIENAGLLKTDL